MVQHKEGLHLVAHLAGKVPHWVLLAPLLPLGGEGLYLVLLVPSAPVLSAVLGVGSPQCG